MKSAGIQDSEPAGRGGGSPDSPAAREKLALSEQLEKLAASVPGLICSFRLRPDGSACMPYASPAIVDVYGLRAEEVAHDAAPLFALIHPDDLAAIHASIAASATSMRPWHAQFRIFHPDKGERWIEGHSLPLREPDGGVLWHGYLQDITERKQVEEEVRIAAVAFQGRDGMVVTDARGVILKVNRSFSEITGYSAEEVVGRTPALLHSGRQSPAFYRTMWEAILREGHWEGEIWNRRRDGGVYPEWLAISAIRDPAGRVSHYLGVFSDISEPREAERKILDLAFYDPLTGLPNRRLLHDRLNQALAGSFRSGQFGCLLLIDLDHFKTLNDTRGHDAGDQLLVEVARRLQDTLREHDTAARLGGDEFVALLENLGHEEMAAAADAEAIAEKLRAALSRPYDLKGGPCHTSPSIGVALFRDRGESVEALLKHADLALYQAKGAGRNAVRFFNPAMQAAIDRRVELENGLRRALAEGELLLHYQPQFGADGRLIGAEALLRWQPPGEAMVLPAAFMPVAEEGGLILPIGKWALETACRQLAAWARQPETRGLELAVNISARQFRQPDFVAQVCAALDESCALPCNLKLELTESLVLDDVERAIRAMRALRDLGVRFSMDDFGTGYSSLAYLKRLPLDQLKIDQSFVCNVPADPDDCSIVQAILGLGRGLRLHVIAEGVETEAQRDFLAGQGCSAYQGYLFGRPGPAQDIEALARGLTVKVSKPP